MQQLNDAWWMTDLLVSMPEFWCPEQPRVRWPPNEGSKFFYSFLLVSYLEQNEENIFIIE